MVTEFKFLNSSPAIALVASFPSVVCAEVETLGATRHKRLGPHLFHGTRFSQTKLEAVHVRVPGQHLPKQPKRQLSCILFGVQVVPKRYILFCGLWDIGDPSLRQDWSQTALRPSFLLSARRSLLRALRAYRA